MDVTVERTAAVRRWLLVVFWAIVLMVAIGGTTRLTGSGLSITEWQPFRGALPPLNEADWQLLFDKYKTSPQFTQVNAWMTLADFERIFWWEWIHRQWGRFIGLLFFVPWVYFMVRGHLQGVWRGRTAVAFVLGGLQGLLGWFMVASGLVDEPRVSHYRLTAHLMLAFFVAQYVLWIWQGLGPQPPGPAPDWSVRRRAWGVVALLTLQCTYGALLAGTRGGWLFPTFPDFNGAWIPPNAGTLSPFWRDVLDNPETVNLIHRVLGLLTLGAIFDLWRLCRRHVEAGVRRRSLDVVLGLALCQVTLGIVTVMTHMQLHAAVTHQVGGLLLLSAACLFAFRVRTT